MFEPCSLEDVERDLLLRILRAAGDPDQIVGLNCEQSPQLLGARIVPIGLDAVVLDRASDVETARSGAQAPESIGVVFRLHGEQVHFGKQSADQPTQKLIAAEAARTKAEPVSLRHRPRRYLPVVSDL